MASHSTSEPELLAGDVTAWHHTVTTASLPLARTVDADVERVDLIASLELLKRAITATQADLAVDLDASQRAQQAVEGVPAERRGAGVAAQVALARQESPHRGAVLLGLARAMVHELPHTRGALRQGLISEHAALLVAQETACLEPEDRAQVDEAVCADGVSLHGLNPRRLAAQVRRLAATLDPASVVRRARRAESERHVSLRPAPDTMTYLTALVPVAQGVATYAALGRDADAARSGGDERGRGQLMADLLVQRVTGQTTAEAVPVAVNLAISDATLLGAGAEPALLIDAGSATDPVPAQIARELVARALDAPTDTWLRRLYASPAGDLVATSSRQRFVRGGLADLLRVRVRDRDRGLCRTPWCDAPARQVDHAEDHADGGVTDLQNCQSLCLACHRTKHSPGWVHRARPGPERHVVEISTPTGHLHASTAPPQPQPATPACTWLDRELDQLLDRLATSTPGREGRHPDQLDADQLGPRQVRRRRAGMPAPPGR